MQRWKKYLEGLGKVEMLDYSYMLEGRRRPDPLPQLLETHRRKLRELQTKQANRIFLIGKSMGGRIGCHLALEEKVEGLICLGYPLCGGGDRSKLRDKVLRELTTRILFVQGTRDSLCPLELLEKVREEMTAHNFLHVVEGGDHSLMAGKKALRVMSATQEEIDARVLAAIARFVE